MAADCLCSGEISTKSSNGLHFSITSDQRPLHRVAKTGHNASLRHWYALTQVRSLSKWIRGCYADHAVENSFLVAHATGCTYKSRGIVVGSVQTVAAIANDESLQVRVRKSYPPEGRSSRHPSAHKGAKTGCAPTLRNAASSQKHCSVACKAHVNR